MTITLTQPSDAPNFCFEVLGGDGSSEFIQTDWEYPSTASRFGFVPCECGQTDGTVDCEHKTATQMISAAYDYLVEHEGETVESCD